MMAILNNIHEAFYGGYVSERRLALMREMNSDLQQNESGRLRGDMVAILKDLGVAYHEAKQKVNSNG